MKSPFKRDLKKALFIIWAVLSSVTLFIFISGFFVGDGVIYDLSRALQSPHENPCLLCGMTESCVSITKGDLSGAYEANQMSIPLFSLLSINWLILFSFFIIKFKKGKV